MEDAKDFYRGMADAALTDLDELLDTAPANHRMTTDELGCFWLALTEGATMRLIRLKPELVRHAKGDPEWAD